MLAVHLVIDLGKVLAVPALFPGTWPRGGRTQEALPLVLVPEDKTYNIIITFGRLKNIGPTFTA